MKRTPTDAEIEAIVADARGGGSRRSPHREAQPPSSAIVWWRAQMRARQEAARLAEQPITIVHALSIAAGIGLDAQPRRLLGRRREGLAGVGARRVALRSRRPPVALPLDLTGRWLSADP